MPQMIHRTIRIESSFNQKTGLMAAFSEDLQGLLVVGKTKEEITKKLPGAVRELLEAMGNRVSKVSIVEDAEADWQQSAPRFRAEANLDQAA